MTGGAGPTSPEDGRYPAEVTSATWVFWQSAIFGGFSQSRVSQSLRSQRGSSGSARRGSPSSSSPGTASAWRTPRRPSRRRTIASPASGSAGILPWVVVLHARGVDSPPHHSRRAEIGDPERTPRDPARGRGRPFARGGPCASIVAPPPDRGGGLSGAPRGRRAAPGVGARLAKSARDGFGSPPALKEPRKTEIRPARARLCASHRLRREPDCGGGRPPWAEGDGRGRG